MAVLIFVSIVDKVDSLSAPKSEIERFYGNGKRYSDDKLGATRFVVAMDLYGKPFDRINRGNKRIGQTSTFSPETRLSEVWSLSKTFRLGQ
jgi:hypothetical protein